MAVNCQDPVDITIWAVSTALVALIDECEHGKMNAAQARDRLRDLGARCIAGATESDARQTDDEFDAMDELGDLGEAKGEMPVTVEGLRMLRRVIDAAPASYEPRSADWRVIVTTGLNVHLDILVCAGLMVRRKITAFERENLPAPVLAVIKGIQTSDLRAYAPTIAGYQLCGASETMQQQTIDRVARKSGIQMGAGHAN